MLGLRREERRDLFFPRPLPVLAIQVRGPQQQERLFRQVAQEYPELDYYDADLPLALRYAAVYGVFPLARCQVSLGPASPTETAHPEYALERGAAAIQPLDTPWALDPPRPPLRLLVLEPDPPLSGPDPGRAGQANRRWLIIRAAQLAPAGGAIRPPQRLCRLALQPARPLLVNLRALLEQYDPDLLLTRWGDTWLLPRLLKSAHVLGLPLPLSRDPEREAAYRRERSYFSYGQVIYRGRQVLLFGRWHIDCHNAMLWDEGGVDGLGAEGSYGLEGVLETARVTGLPVQTAARVSPGTGISAMQILTALRLGVLAPWRKQQVEAPKTARQLFAADQGGLVYQPRPGLYRDVAELDFISMYPGIMVRFNISPETRAGEAKPGLVPQTLAPLLAKRLALKQRLASLPAWHPQRLADQQRAAAHKWLLVTCFGYLGYKNARFGRIEAHEAVTAHGREALLQAKEAAEDLGYTVLHLYVDGIWVHKPGATTPADLQPLVQAILERTGLPIALDGIYRWVAFSTSRPNPAVPVANRYFGVFQDGTLKVRGIEARRRDTPPFIGAAQVQALEAAAPVDLGDGLAVAQGRLLAVFRRGLARLRRGQIPLAELVVTHRLGRELDKYRARSAGREAASQLQAAGFRLRAGQRVQFIYTRGEPGVHAWDLPQPLDPRTVDLERYRELFLRAAETILAPFGLGPEEARSQLGELPGKQLRLIAPQPVLKGKRAGSNQPSLEGKGRRGAPCGRPSTALAPAQGEDAADNQQAAQPLRRREHLAQEEVSQQGGAGRLEGGDQVGHAGGQIGQADGIQAVAAQGRAQAEDHQHHPAGQGGAQPQQIGGSHPRR